MAKLIDLMRQAGVQWPEGAEYAAQDADDKAVMFYRTPPRLQGEVWRSRDMLFGVLHRMPEVADDWRVYVMRSQWFNTPSHLDPDYMREQQRIAARRQDRRDLVRELMLRHPELTGQQAIKQADEIIDTLEGLRDGA